MTDSGSTFSRHGVYNSVDMNNSPTYRLFSGKSNPCALALLISTTLLNGCGGGNARVIEPPTSLADDFSMYSTDAALEVTADTGVLANDNDGDQSGLKAVLVTPPEHAAGDFALAEDGSFRYTPDSPDVHADHFTYQAANSTGASPETTVRITIIPNQRPVASADDYLIGLPVAPLEVAADKGLLANDSDADNDPLSVRLITPPQHHQGDFELAADGGFRYEFDDSDATTDQFTYIVSDGKADSEPATVTIRINTPPKAANDCQVHDKTGPIRGQLGSLVSDAEDQHLTWRNITPDTQTNLGQLSLDADSGAFTYTPTASGTQGYRDTFTYQVDDGHGGVSQAQLQIIVGKRRIMPLGDSITWGVTSVEQDPASGQLVEGPAPDEAIGYRKKLLELLAQKAYPVDFVGGEHNGEAAGLTDPDHQGIPGITSAEVAARVYNWLDQNPADLVLLHIGTNDQNESTQGVNDILAAIDQWATDHDNPVKVLLAKIIDEKPFGKNAFVNAFNQNLETLVANDWPNVTLVDQFHALAYPDDMSDNDVTGLHPAQSGYDKMATKWFETLEAEKLIFTCKPKASAGNDNLSPPPAPDST